MKSGRQQQSATAAVALNGLEESAGIASQSESVNSNDVVQVTLRVPSAVGKVQN